MANLVGEHGFKFRFAQLLDERVEQHDFPPATKACEKSIGVTRPFAAVHHLNVPGVESGFAAEREQSLTQAALRKGTEFVEERHDHGWRQHKHQQLESEHD